jgi:hypothetical protein
MDRRRIAAPDDRGRLQQHKDREADQHPNRGGDDNGTEHASHDGQTVIILDLDIIAERLRRCGRGPNIIERREFRFGKMD